MLLQAQGGSDGGGTHDTVKSHGPTESCDNTSSGLVQTKSDEDNLASHDDALYGHTVAHGVCESSLMYIVPRRSVIWRVSYAPATIETNAEDAVEVLLVEVPPISVRSCVEGIPEVPV